MDGELITKAGLWAKYVATGRPPLDAGQRVALVGQRAGDAWRFGLLVTSAPGRRGHNYGVMWDDAPVAVDHCGEDEILPEDFAVLATLSA